jgi:hypothetical protein|tara:strand:+ start:277 stop:519 length:243 start_codon:yes stop_codon:yes gene_type:complete
MSTLRTEIKDTKQGIKFIKYLIKNNMMFHLDDDVSDIIWHKTLNLDLSTINLIHKRHQELWAIGNPWDYADKIITQYLKD